MLATATGVVGGTGRHRWLLIFRCPGCGMTHVAHGRGELPAGMERPAACGRGRLLLVPCPEQAQVGRVTAENRTDAAPLCLTFGWAAKGDVCCDCGDGIDEPAFVMVGRLNAGRLCEPCAERTPFGLVAEALDRLDTAVFMTHDRGDPAALMALNVQGAVRELVEREWLPRCGADVPDGAA